MSRPKLPRPSRPRDNVGIFNETIFIDLAAVKDSKNVTHWYMVIVDDGTDYTVVRRIDNHTEEHLYQATEDAWISWAGPADLVVGNGERGVREL